MIPFELSHATANLPPVAEALLHHYLKTGEGWTICAGGEPVAAGGVMIFDGLGSAWGLVGERAKQMPFALHRYTKRIIIDIMARHNLRRVDMIADPEKPETVRWATALGFQKEGEMRNFYPDGRTAWFMARTK